MTLGSISLFTSPILPPASAPGIFLLADGTAEAPMAITPGLARDLIAPVALGDSHVSLFSSEIATGVAWDEHSLVADAWPLDDPDTGELIAPKDFLLAVLGAFLLLSVFSIAQIKMSGGWQQWKKRQNELRAATQVASAKERLESLLQDRARVNPQTPVRHYLDLDDTQQALEVALAVLTLWRDRITSEGDDTLWEILLVSDPAMESIAPSLMLVAMPAGKFQTRRTESILVRVGPDARLAPVEFPTAKDMAKYIKYLEP